MATSPFPRHLRGGRSVPGASPGVGASHLNPQGPPARGSNSVTVPASPSARGEGVRSGVSALPASQLASPGSEVSPLHRAVSQSPGKRGRRQCQSRPGRSPGAARLPTPCNPIFTPAPAPRSRPESLPRMVTHVPLPLDSRPGSPVSQRCGLAVLQSPSWGPSFLVCRSQRIGCDYERRTASPVLRTVPGP